ncbi:PLDc N-terminal domain-containing protein [Paenarthrobacter sp. NPDC056912]|uniref:SHOCT domain-containing protein n=1 Tax=Paenarthrobacter sp. NPDC056912 TaxID=3345965 RepID=UPI00366F3E0D
MNIFEAIWFAIGIALYVTYLIVLFHIVADIFADSRRSGWSKALWVVGLLFLPVLGGLAYLVFNGQSMSMRRAARADVARDDFQRYVQTVAGTNVAQQISEAKTLMDDGALTEAEFAALKERLLRA